MSSTLPFILSVLETTYLDCKITLSVCNLYYSLYILLITTLDYFSISSLPFSFPTVKSTYLSLRSVSPLATHFGTSPTPSVELDSFPETSIPWSTVPRRHPLKDCSRSLTLLWLRKPRLRDSEGVITLEFLILLGPTYPGIQRHVSPYLGLTLH